MADNSKIEWCDATWNPVVGCSPVSPGCDHCYASRMAHRLGSNPATPQFAGLTVDGKWKGKTRLVEKNLDQPFGWKKLRRIFVCSMGDLFHESVSFDDIARVFAVMSLSDLHNHQFMVLTKRPARMLEFIECFERDVPLRSKAFDSVTDLLVQKCPWPMPHVILMTTAEDQPRADERMPHIAELTGKGWRTGVSVEPMLGPVDLSHWLEGWMCRRCGVARLPMGEHGYCDCPIPDDPEEAQGDHRQGMVDWVIAGGETGPGARPAHPDWFRSLRDQCADAGTPFFFKGWGEWGTTRIDLRDGSPAWDVFHSFEHYCAKAPTRMHKGDKLICPDGHVPNSGCREGKTFPMAIINRVGRQKSGRWLDGVAHNAFPGDHVPF